jgi:uncharacterized membrane protein HdeD (DUF308 family)
MNADLKWMQKLFLGICTMVIGAFIIFQTKGFTMFLAIAIGIYAVVNGIMTVSAAYKAKLSDQMKRALFVRGAASCLIGLLALLLPVLFVKITWTFVLYLLGIQLLVSAILQIYLSVEMRRLSLPIAASVVEVVVSVVLAFLVFTMPQEIGMTIVRVAGFIVFSYGLVLVVHSFRTHRVSDRVL